MIGDKIKELRKKAGISQQELADRLETTPQNLSQYETGKRQPKIETIQKMANALGVDVWELYDDYELPPIESDKEFEHSWENLLIMNDIRFMSYTKVSGERGMLFAIDDDKFRYFLTSEQCEKLPSLAVEQIKTLIKAISEEPFTKISEYRKEEK